MPASAIPSATYRLQFNRDFTFRQAVDIIDYLHELGISHIYASPYLKARPGSPHGYDIVDHNVLNPDIGSTTDYVMFLSKLHQNDMGQILDIVPNHMAVMGSDNGWWLDVLENGPSSTYASYFDIDWQPVKAELRGKILLPVLGDHYGIVLRNGDLVLRFDPDQARFAVHYYEHLFPIDPREYPQILQHRVAELESVFKDSPDAWARYQEVCTGFTNLPHRNETLPATVETRQQQITQLRQQLSELCHRYPAVNGFILENVNLINGQPESPDSFQHLHQLLETQAYRLAYWRVAGDEINYRRFFDINNLAGLRVENEEVFDTTHRFILDQIAAGNIQGLRIDHVDGLYDPLQYLQRLNQRVDDIKPKRDNSNSLPDFYIVVEKIIASYEHLPISWPVAGTTGYEFANLVNGLQVNTKSAKLMRSIYHRFIHHAYDFDEVVYHAKRHIESIALGSELLVLAFGLNRISESSPETRDYTLNALRDALLEIVACFPVYRTYRSPGQISEQDVQYIDWAVAQARKHSKAADLSVFDFIRSVLLVDDEKEEFNSHAAQRLDFAMKLQQYTAPVMAKGFEDTALYNYHCLVSLNEVGGDPRHFGTSANAFHHINRERQLHWPHTMLCLSTHDNKRSADVRARIDVLSEVPEQWYSNVARWSRLNRSRKKRINGELAPSRNDEYLLYQTLIGTWPICQAQSHDKATMENYMSRIQAYMLKAIREAKDKTSWTNPGTEYEQVINDFVAAILNIDHPNPFLDEITLFNQKILPAGLFNALSQYQILLTAPGVPDIYQGNELWDFSLVDPDNRRPLDFAEHASRLSQLREFLNVNGNEYIDRLLELVRSPKDGRIKQFLIWKMLNIRRDNRDVFDHGNYQPLETSGAFADNITGFARTHEDKTVFVIIPHLIANLINETQPYPIGDLWRNTMIKAPLQTTQHYYNALTGQTVNAIRQEQELWLRVCDVLAVFPTAFLMTTD